MRRRHTPGCDEVGGPCVFPDATDDASGVNVFLEGPVVNQPADGGGRADPATWNAPRPQGASFTLDGRASGDPDQNLALAASGSAAAVGPLRS